MKEMMRDEGERVLYEAMEQAEMERVEMERVEMERVEMERAEMEQQEWALLREWDELTRRVNHARIRPRGWD